MTWLQRTSNNFLASLTKHVRHVQQLVNFTTGNSKIACGRKHPSHDYPVFLIVSVDSCCSHVVRLYAYLHIAWRVSQIMPAFARMLKASGDKWLTSTMSISSLSFMLSTVRQPWLMKKYSPASNCTSSFSVQHSNQLRPTVQSKCECESETNC